MTTNRKKGRATLVIASSVILLLVAILPVSAQDGADKIVTGNFDTVKIKAGEEKVLFFNSTAGSRYNIFIIDKENAALFGKDDGVTLKEVEFSLFRADKTTPYTTWLKPSKEKKPSALITARDDKVFLRIKASNTTEAGTIIVRVVKLK